MLDGRNSWMGRAQGKGGVGGEEYNILFRRSVLGSSILEFRLAHDQTQENGRAVTIKLMYSQRSISRTAISQSTLLCQRITLDTFQVLLSF